MSTRVRTATNGKATKAKAGPPAGRQFASLPPAALARIARIVRAECPEPIVFAGLLLDCGLLTGRTIPLVTRGDA
jgi:hypothetical protein